MLLKTSWPINYKGTPTRDIRKTTKIICEIARKIMKMPQYANLCVCVCKKVNSTGIFASNDIVLQ